MAKEICISSTPHETRLAILEDDQLAEIYYERENEYTLAGSVYKGRVTRVLPGMQSAFVDIGLERDAFLYVTDFMEEQEDSADFEKVGGGGNRRDNNREGRGDRGEGRGERGEGRGESRNEGRHEPRGEGRGERSGERGERSGERGEGRGERGEGRSEGGRSQERGDNRREPREVRESEPRTRTIDIDAAPPAAGRSEEHGSSADEDAQGTRRWRGRRGRRRGGLRIGGDQERQPASGETQESIRASAEDYDTSEPVSTPERGAPGGIAAAHSPILLPGESLSRYGGKPESARSEPAASAPAKPAVSYTSRPSTLIESPLEWTGSGLLPGESRGGSRRNRPAEREATEPSASQPSPHGAAETASSDLPAHSVSYSETPAAASIHLDITGETAVPPIAPPVAASEPAGNEVAAAETLQAEATTEAAQTLAADVAEAPALTTPVPLVHDEEEDVTVEEVSEYEPQDDASASHRVDPVSPSEFRLATPQDEAGTELPEVHATHSTEAPILPPVDTHSVDVPEETVAPTEQSFTVEYEEEEPSAAATEGEPTATHPSGNDPAAPSGGVHRPEPHTPGPIPVGGPAEHTAPEGSHPEESAAHSEALAQLNADTHTFAPGAGLLEEELIDEEEYDFSPIRAQADDSDLEEIEEETLEQQYGTSDLGEMVREAHLEQRVRTPYPESENGTTPEDEEDESDEDDEDEDEGEEEFVIGESPEAEASESTSDAAAAPARPQRERRDDRRGGRRGGHGRRRQGGGGAPHRRSAQTSDLPIISDLLKQGQEILVQIAKEPIAKKGARITSHIALPGRFLVFMPTVNHVGVSRKISSDEERLRLKRILISEKGEASGGFIVRTAADGASEDELRADLRFLISLWTEIKQRSEDGKAPALIYHDLNLVERILRDQVSDNFSTIWVDSETDYERIVRFLNRFQPSLVRRVKLYTKETPLFEQFGIQEEITKALKSKVWLKSGGSIVINQTEALVAIDINTGKYVGKTARLEDTILKTNLDAIPEIVRQIRLRDLGGIIVIDFIDMDERKNRHKVMQALEDELKHDRAPSKVLQFNDFGLVAITRKRVKQSLERTLSVQCGICAGTGMVKSPATVCNEIYTELRKMQRHLDGKDVLLRVNPEVVKVLKNNNAKWLNELEEMIGKTIIVKSDPALHPEQFDIH